MITRKFNVDGMVHGNTLGGTMSRGGLRKWMRLRVVLHFTRAAEFVRAAQLVVAQSVAARTLSLTAEDSIPQRHNSWDGSADDDQPDFGTSVE